MKTTYLVNMVHDNTSKYLYIIKMKNKKIKNIRLYSRHRLYETMEPIVILSTCFLFNLWN